MAIVGEKPESGVRVRIERAPRNETGSSEYAGTVTTPDEQWNVSAAIDAAGDVKITSDAPASVIEKVRLLVRTAVRHASDGGAPLPRVIHRWRADR
jgi:hypothetical protein